MKFTFAEKRMDSSEDLRAYAEKKIGKLDRFFKTEADASVTFSIERGRFLAEITIRNNGLFYRASELTNDMYASIDSGVAAIERQIRRNKTRLEKRLRDGVLERDAVPAYVPAEEEDKEEEFKVVRSKRFSIKPMSVQILVFPTSMARIIFSVPFSLLLFSLVCSEAHRPRRSKKRRRITINPAPNSCQLLIPWWAS